jgi:hypothetical protein
MSWFKVETIFLPNGLSTVFGPLSARQVPLMSNVNAFLTILQTGRFQTAGGNDVLYGVLGNKTYNLGFCCIKTYFIQFLVVLLLAMRCCELFHEGCKDDNRKELCHGQWFFSRFVLSATLFVLENKTSMPWHNCVFFIY